jgi:hypothetical protein
MEEDATVVSSEALGNIATVKISLPKTDEAPSVHFAWTLVVEPGENAETSLWKTERVAINP